MNLDFSAVKKTAQVLNESVPAILKVLRAKKDDVLFVLGQTENINDLKAFHHYFSDYLEVKKLALKKIDNLLSEKILRANTIKEISEVFKLCSCSDNSRSNALMKWINLCSTFSDMREVYGAARYDAETEKVIPTVILKWLCLCNKLSDFGIIEHLLSNQKGTDLWREFSDKWDNFAMKEIAKSYKLDDFIEIYKLSREDSPAKEEALIQIYRISITYQAVC